MHALLVFVGAWLILWGAFLSLLIARGHDRIPAAPSRSDRIEVAL